MEQVDITVSIPAQVLRAVEVDDKEFGEQMKSYIALKLFVDQKISSGLGGALAGIHKIDFIQFLGRHKISIFGTLEEIMKDFENAGKYCNR